MKNLTKSISILFLCLSLVGCTAYRSIRNLDKQQAEIQNISTEIVKIQESARKLAEEHQAKIDQSVKDRVSVGGAQAISVLGTLKANPVKDKYTSAGIKGLTVTEEALLDQVKVQDLIEAIKIQSQLISEQAEQIAEADKKLGILSTEINQHKDNEKKLVEEKKEAEEKAKQQVDSLAEQRAKLEKEYQDYKNEIDAKNQKDAEQWRKENAWYNRINPFHGLGNAIGKLLGWVAFIFIFVLIVKALHFFFPQVHVVQVVAKSIGRLIGAVFKIFSCGIPDVLHGMKAIEYEKYEQEKQIANGSLGAIQEFKNDDPEGYKAKLKNYLIDWHGKNPELDKIIDQRLEELNVK